MCWRSGCSSVDSSRCVAATPLFVGMLSHGLVDLITHRTWEYNHFFPVPLPPIRGLVAYTDPGFTILEHTALLVFFVWLFARRRAARAARDVTL